MRTGTPTLPADLVRVHWQTPWPASRRRRRWVLAVVIVAVVAYATFAVVVAVTGGGLRWLLQPALMGVVLWGTYRRGTSVTPQGVGARYGLLPGRRVHWADVVQVLPAGRWRDWGYVRLADGRVLELVGMAPDDVARLTAALAEAPAQPGDARD